MTLKDHRVKAIEAFTKLLDSHIGQADKHGGPEPIYFDLVKKHGS